MGAQYPAPVHHARYGGCSGVGGVGNPARDVENALGGDFIMSDVYMDLWLLLFTGGVLGALVVVWYQQTKGAR